MTCCKNIVDVALFFFLNSSPDLGYHFFFFLPFSAMAMPQLPQIFFPPYFGNGITTIGFPLGASHFEHFTPTRLAGLDSRNFGNMITEIQNFLSPTFLFLSDTFVEFRQYHCQNSLSFLNSLNKLEQCL